MSFAENVRWLRLYSDAYAGQWVALRSGVLVDHDTSRKALQERLEARDDLRDLLITLR